MVADLIVALLAAVFVAVIPGWYWAATLIETDGRFERLIYSTGFSVVLTSVVAYLPARLLGTGVTLSVAIFSPVLIFVSGALIHHYLGAASGPKKRLGAPAIHTIRKPGLPVLLPLVPAALIVAGWNFGYLTGVFWLAVTGGLTVVAGLLYVIFLRKEKESDREDEPSVGYGLAPSSVWIRRAVVAGVFLLVLVRAYIGPVLQDWPFVQGVDHYSHAVMANLIQSRGEIYPYLIYPPGFHTLTAMISRISALRPLELFPVLAPMLFVLPSLSLYALGNRLWGWQCGVVAAFLVGVVANGPYIFYNDAMYPNLITSEFLLVLAVAALVALYSNPSWRSVAAVALFGASPVFFHQVGSLYAAGLFGLIALYVLPFLLLRDRRRGMMLFVALAALGSLAVLYAWDTYDLPRMISEYLGSGETSETGSAVSQAVGTQRTYPPNELFGMVLTVPVAWLGLLGAFFILPVFRRRSGKAEESNVASSATILLWTLVLCVGAATILSGFPQRFGQDLSLPLSLLAALAAVTLLKTCSPITDRVAFHLSSRIGLTASGTALLLLLCAGGISAYWTVRNLEPDGGPAVQLSYAKELTITPEIAEAGEWLRQHNDGGNVIISPQANQVPSRMMLAMGEYPGYQSFSQYQLANQRDLPPGGADPLWEVLQVVNFPDTERAQEIIRDRDVRYIVLYKSMPDRGIAPYYERFQTAEARNLYETSFENDDVLIVRLRDDVTEKPA